MSFHRLATKLYPNFSYTSSRSVDCFLAQSRPLRVSAVSMSDSKEKDPKAKLNDLLRSIKESNERKKELQAKLSLKARPRKKIVSETEAVVKEKINKKKAAKFASRKELEFPDEGEVRVDPELLQAARRVASDKASLEGDDSLKDVTFRKTESELLTKLRSMTKETENAKFSNEVSGGKDSLTSLFGSMKVEKSDDPDWRPKLQTSKFPKRELTEAEIAFLERRKRLRQEQRESSEEIYKVKGLFTTEPPLGIFPQDFKENATTASNLNETFQLCLERELRILSKPSARNFLEEMADWTEKGILWQFPINNEQGIDESELEPFYEHVFLEPHLEPWCPPRGPVRHFMELICVGLSKNPHVSVEKKVEHIMWFKDYFEKKEHTEILKITGAIDVENVV